MALLKTGISGSASASAGSGAGQSRAGAAARYGQQLGPGGWHPTILYMLGLVVAEVLIAAWLSRHLLK